MNDQMMDVLILISGSLVLGIALGVRGMYASLNKRLDEAYRKAKAEFEAEKTELSGQLSQQLVQIRAGLAQTVEAYEKAVQVVEEKLPLTPEYQSALGIAASPQLQLEFQRESKDVTRRPPT